MSVERFIALRYLKPRKDNLYVSLIGLISILGVTVGVSAIILVLSILNGFEREVKSRFIGFDAHLKVKRPHEEPIAAWEGMVDTLMHESGVVGVSPYILQKAMVTSAGGSHVAYVKGVLRERILSVTNLEKSLTHGAVDFSEQPGGYNGMVTGYSIDLSLESALGDTLTIISPVGVTNPFSIPEAKRFVLAGVFKTEMFEYDNAYVFIGLADAQKLFEMEDAVSGIDLVLSNIEEANDVRRSLEARLGTGWVVETWYDQHEDLYSAMEIEKWGSLVLLSLIIIVASFNIVSTLIMVVMQKSQDIGILQSMGAGSPLISRIFIHQGLMVGGVGIVTGCLIGYGICFLQVKYQFIKLPGDIFFLDALPMELKWVDFVAIVIVALFISLFSTVYPARKASALLPMDALRA